MRPFTAFPSWSHMASIGFISGEWAGQGSIRSMLCSSNNWWTTRARWGRALSSIKMVFGCLSTNGTTSFDVPYRIQVAIEDDHLCTVLIRDASLYHDTPRCPCIPSLIKPLFWSFDSIVMWKGIYSSMAECQVLQFIFSPWKRKTNVFTHALILSLIYPNRVKSNQISFNLIYNSYFITVFFEKSEFEKKLLSFCAECYRTEFDQLQSMQWR